MTDLYENLLKATNNIDDITTEKYATVTKLNGNYCDAKEEDTGLEHTNVPIINGANLSVGDKAIIGFLNNSIYDVVCYGALDKTIHDDTKQDKLISGENIKTINHQSLLGSGNIEIQGGGSDVDIVTSWEPTPSDTKVPSEKLSKNTLDTKVDKVTGKGLSTNDFTNSYKNTIDGLSTVATTGDYDDLTDKPSIPSSSSDLSDGSNIVKKSSTSGLLKNDGTVDTTSYSTFSGSYNDLSGKPTIPSASTTTPSADTSSGSYGSGTNYARSNHTHPQSSLYAEATHSHTKSQITDFPTIPTNTSDLTNDGADGTNVFVANNDSRLSDARTPTSHTHGQITNAGAITSTAVTVASGDNIVITDVSDSSKIKRVTNLLSDHIKDSTAHTNIGSSANDTQATINSDIDTALSNKVSKSSTSGLLKNDGSVDTTAYSTFDGNYNNLTNKPTIPTIPTNVSAFTNDAGYLTQHQSLANYIQKSSTSGLIKNDGTVDTTSYLSSLPSHTHDDRYYTESEVDDALLIKQDLLVSGTNIKTVNNESLLGSGNITIQGGSSVDVVTSWEPTLSDSKVPSEKLVKNTIDGLSIPTKTSDLTNDGDGTNAFLTQHQSLSNYVQKSSTTGLLKNDGSVDTTQYLSSLPSHNHDDRYYTESEVDTALNGKQATLISGNNIKTINNTSLLGSGNITIGGGGSSVDIATSWGNPTSDSKVPSEKLTKSSLDSKIDKSQTVGLVKNDGTIDTTSYSTFSGSYNDLTNKPSIPSKTSDLTNDSNFISKSSTNGLMKNDGTIDTTTYVNTNDSRLSDARTPLSHTHTSSQVTDLIDVIYPVGSIYMSVNSTSPQTLFGGTWEQIQDKFLLASGSTYSNGATGGSADATLVSHNHTTRENGEYFVTSENSDSNNTKVSYSASGNRYVDGMTSNSTPFHHRTATGYQGSSGTGKNMPPYLAVNVWKRTA